MLSTPYTSSRYYLVEIWPLQPFFVETDKLHDRHCTRASINCYMTDVEQHFAKLFLRLFMLSPGQSHDQVVRNFPPHITYQSEPQFILYVLTNGLVQPTVM